MSTATIKVVSHNIGGGTTYGTHLYSDGTAQIGSVMRLVQNDPAIDAITLQECLRGEFDEWIARGWYGTFVLMTTADENKFRGNQDKGQAVLSRYPILSVDVVPLPVTSGVVTQKDFSLVCAQIDHPGFTALDDLYVSTTHLWSSGLDPNGVEYPGSTNDAIRELQAQTIADYLNPRVGWSRKYILTGDFNTGPKTAPIDHLHRVNRDGTVGTAKFWEADQYQTGTLQRGGRDTVPGRKIDYWFASFSGAAKDATGIDMTLTTASENGGDKHDKILNGKVKWTNIN